MYWKRKAVRLAVMNGEGQDGRAKVEGEASPNKRMHRSAGREFLVMIRLLQPAPGDAWC